ncbi:DNA cytosine methyltransferase [Burkholderia multivorans]|uniref:DNA cytosine methyltransferase n=1 Tax=Burkholderia multivorans TaxID=87883 RepID=UPI0009E0C506|nr:DNA cytosine methyltransferase [Burkholderia multivorans]MCA8504783.1 DNA cytosine methyltransferase [Burkholderia multivorans]MDN8083624.1 DNA cytosine methyltransferase [Burkholderia multivorans]PRE29284.1 DNA cytosine methyltransferase [Burkholderia multivorans]SAK30375.1 modification methylase HgiDII [Burkholderia multivorans]SAK34075.1 modification methylase HgiDII [Burkholderia multivorans]
MSKTARTIRQKIARLQSGGKPRVLDLFAGCGGISLGFSAAGFSIAGAVEFDPEAAASHGRNFHGGDVAHSQARDITKTSPDQLAKDLQVGPTADAFDVLVGGPPCQAFARVGRPKLREVDNHAEAFKHDPRAQLYIDYLRYVEAFAPLAVMVENVPDVLNHGGQNIAEEIAEVLESKGYICRYTLLNAAFYGVPQMRERMILIAYRRELADVVTFPEPTHFIDLPPGYEGTRSVALKFLNNEIAEDAHHYIHAPRAVRSLPPAITAEDAIGDLPAIDAREQLKSGALRRGARRFDELMPYDKEPHTAYAKLMRTWPGFEAPEALSDHVIRYLPRDYPLFARMNPGDQYPQAYEHAMEMFEEHLALLAKQGVKIKPGSRRYEEIKATIVPPYDVGKFPNKWRKMWRDQPARTLMAHLGKDSYSHIHYDSKQARTISVREAARLHSFPDGFVFCGTMNPAFRQIGNAVPPLLAKAVALHMMKTLKQTTELGEMADEPARTAATV